MFYENNNFLYKQWTRLVVCNVLQVVFGNNSRVQHSGNGRLRSAQTNNRFGKAAKKVLDL